MVSHISTIKRSVISGTVALALLGTSVTPTLAWGQREQDFTKGALSVLLLGAIVNDARQHRAQEVHPQVYYPIESRPVYHTPVYQAPVQSYYATPAATRRPLRFYDTGTLAIADALQSAKDSGAEFVIGPLAREEVVAAAASQTQIPILALNFLPADQTTPQTSFFQFALSPEEEARAVARRGAHRRAEPNEQVYPDQVAY